MKRILSVILATVLMCSIMTVGVNAAGSAPPSYTSGDETSDNKNALPVWTAPDSVEAEGKTSEDTNVPPGYKTPEELDAKAKEHRKARIAKRADLEKLAINYIQEHWIAVGKTQVETDAAKEGWRADMKALYAEIDGKEQALLTQGLSLREVESEISMLEDMETYGRGTPKTPEEIEEFLRNVNKPMNPINGTASASGGGTVTTISGFVDVISEAYYADAVKWAVDKSVTSGTSETTFSPNTTCSNGQILTFLWRANGQPEPTKANPFTDVKTSDYYYKAALWASEKGLIAGTTLGADASCTRSMVVNYLWKLEGQPTATKATTFTDVDSNADYAKAVAWAVEKGITAGTSATTFTPDGICTRGQIVTFLFRAMGK